MKHVFAQIACAVVGIAAAGHAAGWTVSGTDSTARFQALQAAIDSASAGDTLYLDGGGAPVYGTLAKPLVLVGQQMVVHPKRDGTYLVLTLRTGSDGSKILNMGVVQATFADTRISGVELAYSAVASVIGADIVGLWYHHNVSFGSGRTLEVSGSGNLFENSLLQSLRVGGGGVFRHVSILSGVSGSGSVFDSSVVFGSDESCENCHFQTSMVPGSTYPSWNSYRDLQVDSGWTAWHGSGRPPVSSPLGFTGGRSPLVLDSEGYNIPQSHLPVLSQVNLARGKVSPTDSVGVWIRATRPSGLGR